MCAIRIIGGRWRRRKLAVVNIADLRPTPDRVRETLFDWLFPYIEGAQCLDLFAGTGALGIEALSRGAARVTLVEQQATIAKQLKKIMQGLDSTALVLQQADALQWLATPRQKFDIIFLDPPFGQCIIEQCADLLRRNHYLCPSTLVYAESERHWQVPDGWQVIKQSHTRQIDYGLFKLDME